MLNSLAYQIFCESMDNENFGILSNLEAGFRKRFPYKINENQLNQMKKAYKRSNGDVATTLDYMNGSIHLKNSLMKHPERVHQLLRDNK